MSNDQPSRRPPGKASGNAAPMGSTISIIIAVVAVVIGFLILRNINSNDKPSSSPRATGTTTTVPAVGNTSTTTSAAPAAPTTAPLVFAPGKVIVANASGVGGAAGQMTKALTTLGFTTGSPTDATVKLATTTVYYLAGSEQVARSIAQTFNDPAVVAAAMPTPAPVSGAKLANATVVLMLGKDYGGKALPALAPATKTTTLPAATLNPTSTSGA